MYDYCIVNKHDIVDAESLSKIKILCHVTTFEFWKEKKEGLHVTKIILGIGKIKSCHESNVVRFSENYLILELLVLSYSLTVHVISTTLPKLNLWVNWYWLLNKNKMLSWHHKRNFNLPLQGHSRFILIQSTKKKPPMSTFFMRKCLSRTKMIFHSTWNKRMLGAILLVCFDVMNFKKFIRCIKLLLGNRYIANE